MDFSQAFQRVDERESELIERLRKVVSIDTTNPPGENYTTLIDAFEPEFQRLGFTTERVVVPEELVKQIPLPLSGERVNLVARLNNGKPPLTVYAHTDVVPVGTGWDYDPFAGEIHDGRMYGRGVSDMKGTIATLLTALDVMKELELDSVWDLNVVLCTDEEVGVYPGVYHLAREGYVTAPVLCMEGSQDPILRMGSNGWLDATVTVTGRSCHSGRNYLGINALEESVPIMVELLKLRDEVHTRRSNLPQAPEPGAPSHLRPGFNIDMMNAGVKSNIVPGLATMVINRRVIPEENIEDVKEEIRQAVERGAKQSKALEAKVDFVEVYPAYHANIEYSGAKRLINALKLVQGYDESDLVPTGSGGSTDMAFVAKVLDTDKITTVGVGRVTESKIHGANESIRLSDARAHAKELIYFFSAPHSDE